MSSRIKLKSCPFCGGEAKLLIVGKRHDGEDEWYVSCENVNCSLHPHSTIPYASAEIAAKAWNRRPENTRSVPFGNAAAMREVVELCDNIINDGTIVCNCDIVDETKAKIHAALSKPPRNCDRYETLSEAWRGFLDMCNSRHIDHDPNTSKCLDCPYRKSDNAAKYECFNHWLFAEAEGAANEQG